MHSSTLFGSLLALVAVGVKAQTNSTPVTGILGNATVITNNPPGLTYVATLPTTGSVQGSVSGTANSGGTGVQFTVSFSGLPTSGGPFLYHLHAFPVASDGNCSSTLGHIDPFLRGETPVCDPTLPETCQVGDLSGKYGKITSDPFTASYVDDFASTVTGLGSFFGNRSITLHYANKTRLACANFALAGQSTTAPYPSNTTSNATGSTSPAASATQSFTGAASAVKAPVMLLMGLAAATYFL